MFQVYYKVQKVDIVANKYNLQLEFPYNIVDYVSTDITPGSSSLRQNLLTEPKHIVGCKVQILEHGELEL